MARILLVEDDSALSEIIRFYLTKGERPYDVTWAQTAQEALEAAPKGFDLILLDAVMPDLSGPEVLCRLRVRGVTVPALAVTGLDTGDPALAGFDEVLTKPLTGESLGAALLRHLPAEKIRYD